MVAERRAVIDVGSNSVLLLVAEAHADSWQTIAETSAVTALGAGTKATGQLGEAGMTATLGALAEAFALAKQHGTGEVRAAATMAVRIAQNADEFLRRASAQGTPVEVLSGDEEARLGFLAVANDPFFAAEDRLAILDPGGHSTELVMAHREGAHWAVQFQRSYPIGALALRGGILASECPEPGDIIQASNELDDTIGFDYPPDFVGRLVVLGATATNLVTIRERMTQWEPERVHGQVLDLDEVGRATGALMRMTDAERAAVTGIEKGREKTLHLGALILERFMHKLGVPDCTVSVRGWRHALLETSSRPLAD